MEQTIKEKDLINSVTLTVHIKKMYASGVRFWVAEKLLMLASYVIGIGNIKIIID